MSTPLSFVNVSFLSVHPTHSAPSSQFPVVKTAYPVGQLQQVYLYLALHLPPHPTENFTSGRGNLLPILQVTTSQRIAYPPSVNRLRIPKVAHVIKLLAQDLRARVYVAFDITSAGITACFVAVSTAAAALVLAEDRGVGALGVGGLVGGFGM